MTRVRLVTAALALAAVLIAAWFMLGGRKGPRTSDAGPASTATPSDPARPGQASRSAASRTGTPAVPAAATPFPTRPEATPDPAPFGALEGRVLNWSTGAAVVGAEVTFAIGDSAAQVRTGDGGTFRIEPERAGAHRLATITAPGFLPYAPEWRESPVELALRPGRRVGGLTFYLFPAVDYQGLVVDEAGRPAAGALVRVLGAPQGEQRLEVLETEYTADAQGRFVAHAPDLTVFEATLGDRRGRATLTGDVAITHAITIRITRGPHPRTATLTGLVREASGARLPGAVVRAEPEGPGDPAPLIAITDADGRFSMPGADVRPTVVSTEVEDHPPAEVTVKTPGRDTALLVIEEGARLSGHVRGTDGAPVPAATILVSIKDGLLERPVLTRSLLDPEGAFDLRVQPGSYLVSAAAPGRARGVPVSVEVPATGASVDLTVADGGSVTGLVRNPAGAPIPYARIMLDDSFAGATALPVHAGTVTAEDGRFTLTGLAPGRTSLSVAAGGHHPRIIGGVVITDRATTGPLDLILTPLREGEEPKLELVGIGIRVAALKDALLIEGLVPGGGAEAAGLAAGDQILAIDGTPVVKIGMSAAITSLRGEEGTTVALHVRRKAGPEADVIVERRKLRA